MCTSPFKGSCWLGGVLASLTLVKLLTSKMAKPKSGEAQIQEGISHTFDNPHWGKSTEGTVAPLRSKPNSSLDRRAKSIPIGQNLTPHPSPPHPSPLTPHPSPLTPHPSPLTPHPLTPSPLTPHPSPLTPHPSPLTPSPHPSPLTPHPSPLTPHPSPSPPLPPPPTPPPLNDCSKPHLSTRILSRRRVGFAPLRKSIRGLAMDFCVLDSCLNARAAGLAEAPARGARPWLPWLPWVGL